MNLEQEFRDKIMEMIEYFEKQDGGQKYVDFLTDTLVRYWSKPQVKVDINHLYKTPVTK